jgi:hypothetical protein
MIKCNEWRNLGSNTLIILLRNFKIRCDDDIVRNGLIFKEKSAEVFEGEMKLLRMGLK